MEPQQGPGGTQPSGRSGPHAGVYTLNTVSEPGGRRRLGTNAFSDSDKASIKA
eukprot:CAMPEP_0177559550 /NCGR_PEP_ID=MMETSP0369-20130122/70900_1 /TAXON_ID=447022 ORGANISM="Scrippsiella hangoei-like, Strain SHHI-4" /NCGR_SAMPLE_ID=MMETSP0369 /ASSEMBLY_ACC=CAM_ASM_000364 /LENGTH=52 /DNA_ID=CAMNT_0019046295 /DNA_START=1 /DNA_END=155 /DNA_ORIENTATION=+